MKFESQQGMHRLNEVMFEVRVGPCRDDASRAVYIQTKSARDDAINCSAVLTEGNQS